MVHVKFHIARQGLGEHQRDSALERAAEQAGRTGRLESQGPPGLAARADFGERPQARRAASRIPGLPWYCLTSSIWPARIFTASPRRTGWMRYVSSRESSPAGNRPNHPAIAASSCPGRIHRTSIVLNLPMTEGPGGPGGGRSGDAQTPSTASRRPDRIALTNSM